MAQKSPVLHVIVIGFHHKKGCQVEFSYPPLLQSTAAPKATVIDATDPSADTTAAATNSSDCPAGWKYLPTLALPDGSHNFSEDSVFFNLPSLEERNKTVFGVSCYRQIPVDQLKIRTADVTRSTVQKSVCILASIPVYGYIEVKLSLIAQTYFDQGDFSRTDILRHAYYQLNACLRDASALAIHQHHFVGLPLRDILLRWRYKALILFKLMLLQRRVVCFGSPVRPVCALILGVAALHGQLLERGFGQTAYVRTSRPISPMPTFQDTENNEDVNGTSAHVAGDADDQCVPDKPVPADNDNVRVEKPTDSCAIIEATPAVRTLLTNISVDRPAEGDSGWIDGSASNASAAQVDMDDPNRNTDLVTSTMADPTADGGNAAKQRGSLPRDASVDVLSNRLLQPLCAIASHIWQAPYPIYTSGNLCLPYLSLPYMDLLSDASVRGYTIGTSNILFQQKKQLADVFVDVEAGTIETAQPDVRRQLQLTTEDLRFVDYVLRHVQAPRESAEGSEQWIREQFQAYMLALLRTALQQERQQQQLASAETAVAVEVHEDGHAAGPPANGSNAMPPAAVTPAVNFNKDADHFNAFFVSEWLQTSGWRMWRSGIEAQAADSDGVSMLARLEDTVAVGHPFAGTLSVADMKLKLAQTMNNSESGRKLNQAVNTTSKAVGGAILQAKGALSNWWSSMTTAPPATVPITSSAATTTSVVTEKLMPQQLPPTRPPSSVSSSGASSSDDVPIVAEEAAPETVVPENTKIELDAPHATSTSGLVFTV